MLDFLFVIFYEILEVLALMLKVLVDIVARGRRGHQAGRALLGAAEGGVHRLLHILDDDYIFAAAVLPHLGAQAAARVGQADEVAHGAPLKEADEARVINSPVHAAEDERVHISEGFNGALHRLRNRSDRVIDEFDAAVFADRLHAVLNAAEILYRRDDGFIADAEAPCGGCGKADILFVVPTPKPVVGGGRGENFAVLSPSVGADLDDGRYNEREVKIFIEILLSVADEIIAADLVADYIHLCGDIALKAVVVVKVLGINISHNRHMGRGGRELKLMRRHLNDRYLRLAALEPVEHGNADIADEAGGLARLFDHLINESRGGRLALGARHADAGALREAQEKIRLAGDLHALGHGHVTERNARSFDNEVVILHRVEVAVAAVEGHVAVMQVDIAPVTYAQMLIGQVAADHIVGRASLPAEAEDEHAPLSEIFNQLPKHIYTSP